MPKFKPSKPFDLHKQSSNYGNMSKNSVFLGKLMKSHLYMSGVFCNIYRLLGTFAQDADSLGIRTDNTGSDQPVEPSGQEPIDVGSFMGVQDPILNENRDREYDFDEIPVVKGVYTVSQNELEYARFGLALANDIITMEFHMVTLETELGRRLIPGDVIELPHLREVGIDGRVANKWYEVASPVWSPTGYDPMYARHIAAVILKPLRHQQEFLDLFEREDEYGKTLAEQASNRDAMMAITEANQDKAEEHAYTTWYDTTIMWFDPDHPSQQPYRWNDSGTPPNGEPVSQGLSFPPNPQEGTWFLRLDFAPNRLYRFQQNKWKLHQIDQKREWQPYNWVVKLREFMSDRSEEDKKRGWELRSIHDVITHREKRSDPSPESREENVEPDDILEPNDGRINSGGSGNKE